jgi:hypothetical protein
MSNKKSTRVDSTPATLSNADKKRPTPKKVNFTPIREFNRFTASVMKRFESTRVGASSSKVSKDSLTPLKTPTMVFQLLCFLFSILYYQYLMIQASHISSQYLMNISCVYILDFGHEP